MRRRIDQSDVKAQGSTLELHLILSVWNIGEERGILSVEVKFVDIERNTSGVGDVLAKY